MADFINTIDVLGDDVVMDSIIQRTITEFKDDVITHVGSNAFYECTALETVDLPNVTVIGSESFFRCSSLTSINIPRATFLGSRCIGATGIKSICIPSVKDLTSQQFRDATLLEKIDAPVLERLSGSSVWYMTKAKTLILRNTAMVCELTGDVDMYNDCNIYVPKTMADGSDGVAAYKAATNWSTLADYIYAIEDYPDITGG